MGQKPGGKIGASGCHGLGGNQIFAFTHNAQIMTDDSCLDFSEKTGTYLFLNLSLKERNTCNILK